MAATKSKSGLFETPTKVSPATPRVATKLSRALVKTEPGSPSPMQGTRHSVDRSLRLSLNSKLTIDRRSLKAALASEKLQTRVGKGWERQAKLNLVQEDLKIAKEQMSLIQKEKAQAIDELKEAQKVAEEANKKLEEALVAQQRAEESLEIEKFRMVKLERAGIEDAQKKVDEWRKEIESMRNQHARDAAALGSTTQELERVKQDLTMACDAKNQALNHADDATKIAEIYAEKVKLLSDELVRLKSLIREKEADENKEKVSKCKEEIESLKQQLEKVKTCEEMLGESEAFIEQINVDLEATRMAESYVHNVAGEWKNRVQELEMQMEEANKLEMAALRQKMGLMEMTISNQRGELEEIEHRNNMAKEETIQVTKLAESLKSNLETVKEEKSRALLKGKLGTSTVQTLSEEKTKLMKELENYRDEMEKSKKTMESLASALHQVSVEARAAKKKHSWSEKEHQSYETKLEDLRSVLKVTDDKYETMLGDAKTKIDLLTSTIELSKNEYQNSRMEWEGKEVHLADCVKIWEEKKSCWEKEVTRLVNLMKQSEEEASVSKEEVGQLKESLKEAESEVIFLQYALKEVKIENTKLKVTLLDLQGVVRENEELRARETASLKKVEELSKLLEEATAKRKTEDCDLLPKLELPSKQSEESQKETSLGVNDGSKEDGAKVENWNGQVKDSDEVELKMWESCEIGKKEFLPETKLSFLQEVESKVEVTEGLIDEINGSTKNVDDDGNSSPKKQQQNKKNKKKTLLRKLGSLLKKGSNN